MKPFGTLPTGETAKLYTISSGQIVADITDYGATLVSLWVPDKNRRKADVVLGYDSAEGYQNGDACLGATVGRNANRIKDASFTLNGSLYTLCKNDNGNNLHSGPASYFKRMWTATALESDRISLELKSPHGDQGFPGNALIRVTYYLDHTNGLHIQYDAVCDQDTIFNLTNHSYFNLTGQENPEKAMEQQLTIPGRFFCPDDAENIPTGELRPVNGTAMDFRVPKPIIQDLHSDYEPIRLQNGFDHNWEVFCNPAAILTDPGSGRSMAVITDCPGIQFYSANFMNEVGKGGIIYGKNSAVALETQFYPDSIHHPDWPQPITKAGHHFKSETIYRFVIE